MISHLDHEDVPEKMEDTLNFWEVLKLREDVAVVVSDLTFVELNGCDEPKLSLLLRKLRELNPVIIRSGDEDGALAEIYLENGILREKNKNDLRHIALAVLNECRYIVSWNFKHFVNPKTINAISAVGKMNHLPEVSIVTPSMMLGGF